MSELKVNKVTPRSGTTVTLGDSGDTITIPSGATITNSGTATGFGGGKVLQVITATDTTARSTSSSSFVTASNTLSVSITPSSASNKIFIQVGGQLYMDTADSYAVATIFRDATNLNALNIYGMAVVYGGNSNNIGSLSMSHLDSPNTTSAITYQVYVSRVGTGSAVLNEPGQGTITCFEIQG